MPRASSPTPIRRDLRGGKPRKLDQIVIVLIVVLAVVQIVVVLPNRRDRGSRGSVPSGTTTSMRMRRPPIGWLEALMPWWLLPPPMVQGCTYSQCDRSHTPFREAKVVVLVVAPPRLVTEVAIVVVLVVSPPRLVTGRRRKSLALAARRGRRRPRRSRCLQAVNAWSLRWWLQLECV